MVERNSPFDRRQLGHTVSIGNFRLCVQNLKNTFGSGDIGDDLVVKVAQVHNRIPKHRNIGAECDQDTEGNLIGTEKDNAGKIQAKVPIAQQISMAEPNASFKRTASNKRIPVLVRQLMERSHRFLFGGKALDDTDSGQILVNKRV